MAICKRSIVAISLGMVWSLGVCNFETSVNLSAAEPVPAVRQPPADALIQWNALVARKDAFEKKMEKLKGDFPRADAAAQQALREQFDISIKAFQTDLRPAMLKLAPIVYRQHPDNVIAGEFVLQDAFHANRFAAAAEIADALIKSGHNRELILNIAGVAHFGAHNFATAQKILLDAQRQKKLSEQLGGPYLEAAGAYVEYWKKEQAIRAAEAEAPADQLLPRVRLKTSRGDVLLELFEDQAPNTVANFISLVEKKQYDGTRFHRVMPTFMAQGGDPKSRDDDPSNDGTGGPGYTIACECFRADARMHFAGSLSMAHSGKDSGGSQFFLTHLPTPWLNANAQRQSGHTAFGRVVEGLDVVAAIEKGDTIESAAVVRKRNHDYSPKTAPARR